MKRLWKYVPVLCAVLLAAPGAGTAQEGDAVSTVIGNDLYAAGGNVVIDRYTRDGDILGAGGRVVLSSPAPGAAILAGGQVSVRAPVGEDATLAGGTVEVQGDVGDDVRAAGGTVTLAARIGGDLVAAGGEVDMRNTATVAGDASLAGGRVGMRGRIGRGLTVDGDTVVLDGAVEGPVEITAQTRLEIGPHAALAGDLTYRSPEPATIDPRAVLSGKTEHLPLPARSGTETGWLPLAIGIGVVGLLGVWLVAVVLQAAFPGFTGTAIETMTSQWGKALALGFALVVTLPAASVVLIATVIGVPLGAMLLLLIYPLAVIGGWLLFAVRIGGWGRGLFGVRGEGTAATRLLFALLGVLVLMLLAAVPYLGGIVCLLATSFGVGALALAGWQRYRGDAARQRAWAG